MCGIFGLINKDGEAIDREIVFSATEKLHHRGPDDEGFYFNENIGFGHKRLSIIDLTDKAKQPFEKHNLTLVYNGEIYNFREIRSHLEQIGYSFTSDSDTELIISAYDQWGPEMFERFNGMWAMAIWDKGKKELLLSRDRYGMKPLYIYEDEKTFAFASEIKAFMQIPEWSNQLDEDSIYSFLAEGKLHHNNKTFYKGVTMLEVATFAKFDARGRQLMSKSFYAIDKATLTSKTSNLKYQNLFSKAIQAHYVSDVEVACALSGGLDSSSIVVESVRQGKDVKTFSYAPSEQGFSEYKYVEVLKRHSEIKNLSISPDFEAHLASHTAAIKANEAPLLSMSFISSFLLYENVAKNKIKVLLAGQGADELLLGYNFYYVPFLKHLRKTRISRFISESIALLTRYPKQIIRSLGKKQIRLDQYLALKKPDVEKELASNFQEFYEDQLAYGHLHALLQFEDRVSMAHSVEGRLPFLDREFSTYLCSLPFHQKIVRAIKKVPLRKAMKKLLPREILERKDKMGYLSPQEKWVFDHRAFFLEKIEVGIKENPRWFTEQTLPFIKGSLAGKKNHLFVWRVYSFLVFLEAKF